MKAIVKLNVPEFQIGQEVTVFFKDTMMKKGICEAGEIVRCKDCKHSYISDYDTRPNPDIWCCGRNHILSTVKPDFYCGDAEPKE